MAYTTINDPEKYFRIKLYTGNATDATGITFDTTDTTMQPDLIWIKNRNSTNENNLANSVSGATKYLHSNINQAETTAANSLQSFDSNGFTVGVNANFNTNNNTYVAWCWKETADAGFDIVSYTGNATARTISHSLSAVPKFMLVKDRTASNTNRWATYHPVMGNTHTMYLELDNAKADESYWNDTTPTSSVFSVSNEVTVNANTSTYIAYLFADVQGFSKFGSYTGNGNADGAFVFTGFRPAYVMVKRVDDAHNWWIWDNKRDPENLVDQYLYANENNAEGTDTWGDFLSNGFKLRMNYTGGNASGGTYIYAAFAEAPFVNSNGVPCNAR